MFLGDGMKLQRIKDLREDRDLYQKDLANLLNVSQAQYSRIETGENEITLDSLIRLARFYNVSTDYILGLTNEKKPYSKKWICFFVTKKEMLILHLLLQVRFEPLKHRRLYVHLILKF